MPRTSVVLFTFLTTFHFEFPPDSRSVAEAIVRNEKPRGVRGELQFLSKTERLRYTPLEHMQESGTATYGNHRRHQSA